MFKYFIGECRIKVEDQSFGELIIKIKRINKTIKINHSNQIETTLITIKWTSSKDIINEQLIINDKEWTPLK